MAEYTLRDNGSTLWVDPDGSAQHPGTMPPGTWIVRWAPPPTNRFYLEKTTDFNLPDEVYGNMDDRADRIIRTFLDRRENTGVLLSGIKGSGKTFMAKVVSNKLLAQHGIATVIVSDLFDTGLLSLFLKDISEPVVILFEEFEKVYKNVRVGNNRDGQDIRAMGDKSVNDAQEGLLTLLDGAFVSKKLFLFTCNETFRINDLLMNRPGRVFYHFKYKGVDDDVVKAYCEKKLDKPEHREQVRNICEYLDDGFTFDMLQAIVEESNRYGVPPQDALRDMNIEPDVMSSYYDISVASLNGYDVTLAYDDREMHVENYFEPNWQRQVRFFVAAKTREDADRFRKIIKFEEENYYGRLEEMGVEHGTLATAGEESRRHRAGFGNFQEERIQIRMWLTNEELKEKRRGALVYEKHGFTVTFTRKKPFNTWRYMHF